MSVTQTVEVPVSHKLTIDVPREIPAGPVVITFVPAETEQKRVPVFGCAKGKYRMAKDFDAPLEDFKDYM